MVLIFHMNCKALPQSEQGFRRMVHCRIAMNRYEYFFIPGSGYAFLPCVPCRVYLSARSFLDPLTGKPILDDGLLGKTENAIVHCPGIESLSSDGSVTLADGSVLQSIDTIIFCTGAEAICVGGGVVWLTQRCYRFWSPILSTGYNFSFPFLSEKYVSTDGGTRVRPLYQHTFPPKYAPGLSFLGLCIKIVPMPQVNCC